MPTSTARAAASDRYRRHVSLRSSPVAHRVTSQCSPARDHGDDRNASVPSARGCATPAARHCTARRRSRGCIPRSTRRGRGKRTSEVAMPRSSSLSRRLAAAARLFGRPAPQRAVATVEDAHRTLAASPAETACVHALAPDGKARLKLGCLVLTAGDGTQARLGLDNVAQVSLHGHAGITRPCVIALLAHGMPVVFRSITAATTPASASCTGPRRNWSPAARIWRSWTDSSRGSGRYPRTRSGSPVSGSCAHEGPTSTGFRQRSELLASIRLPFKAGPRTSDPFLGFE